MLFPQKILHSCVKAWKKFDYPSEAFDTFEFILGILRGAKSQSATSVFELLIEQQQGTEASGVTFDYFTHFQNDALAT